jgi:hypothetical protein
MSTAADSIRCSNQQIHACKHSVCSLVASILLCGLIAYPTMKLLTWIFNWQSYVIINMDWKTAFGGGVLLSSMVRMFLFSPAFIVVLTPVIFGVIAYKHSNERGGIVIACHELFKRFTVVMTKL